MSEPQNLMDGLLSEMNRVREIKAEYDKIPEGGIAAAMMRMSIESAEKAISNGDTIQMLACYEDLKAYEM